MEAVVHRIRIFSRALVAWLLLCLLVPQAGWAVVVQAQTPAGTKVSNQATVAYSVAGIAQGTVLSTVATLLVDEKILPAITCQNPAGVPVNSPGANNVLAYTLTNLGNGTQTFSLSRLNQPTAAYTPVYTPVNSVAYDPLNTPAGAIFLGVSGVAGFQAGVTPAYISGANDPVLAAGASTTVYVLSDTPVVPLNAKGDVLLTATSKTAGAAGAALGTHLVGKGAGGTNALVATVGGAAATTCSYMATNLIFSMNKVVLSVTDPYGTTGPLLPTGGPLVMPGSIMTYQITVTAAGVGTATAVAVVDPMPANVTYKPGSITVGGVAQTDAVDADGAAFYVTAAAPVNTANTVYVMLGNLLAPITKVVTFQAVVN
jgi:uncharacterized repeat protein (TIGR01451 family)